MSVPRVLLLLLLLAGSAWAEGPGQLNARAVERLRDNRPGEARDLLKEALRQAPDDQVLRANYASALLMLGLAELKNRQFAEAASSFEEARDFADADARLWLYRAYALMELGEHSLAEVDLSSALALAPDNPDVHRLRGQLYYAQGRLDEALAALRQAQDLAPEDRGISDLRERIAREYRVEQNMRRDYGGQFVISYDDSRHAHVGGQLLEVLEDAYVEVGAWFNAFPALKVPVLVYTRQEFASITESPDWAGASYDGKIRIPLGGMTRLSPQLRSLLYHEYAHVLVRHLTAGHCPTWLNEGIAELAGRSQFDPPLSVLADAAGHDLLYDFLDLEKSLKHFAPDQARLAYEQSYALVSYLTNTFGWYKLSDLLQAYARGLGTEDAFAAAFADFGYSFDQIVRQWRASL